MAGWRDLVRETLAPKPAGGFSGVSPVNNRNNLPAEHGGNAGLLKGSPVVPVSPVFGSVGQDRGSNPTYLPIVVPDTPLTPGIGAQHHAHSQTHREQPEKPEKPSARPNAADHAEMERLDSFVWVPDPARPVAQLSRNIPSKGTK